MTEAKKRCMDCKFIDGKTQKEDDIKFFCLRKAREVDYADPKCPHFENKEVTSDI